jgi:NADH-quinone oxidoreductase subunit L
MTGPLVFLAILTVLGGFFGLADVATPAEHHGATGWAAAAFAPFGHAPMAALAGIAAVLFGLFFAWSLYANADHDPLPELARSFSRAMRNRFYFDEFYESLIAHTQEALAKIADGFDRYFIGGLMVRGSSGVVDLVGRGLRMLQSGSLQTYTFLLALGVAIVLLVVFRRTF